MGQDGRHLASPPSRRAERALIGIGAVALAAAIGCWLVESSAGSGFFLLAATSVLGVVVVRMKNDPSAWRIRPGATERRVVLAVLALLVGALALVALLMISTNRGG